MDVPEILNFQDFLPNLVPNGKKFLKWEKNRLTAAGDNYGNVILSIKVTLEDEENHPEEIHLVAKCIPPNDFMKRFMNCPVTFRNELTFYQTILPCLKNFEQEQRSRDSLDFFPKFFAGRLSLDPSSESADQDAILFLENLKQEGFFVVDRTIGFDLETSKLILTKMADFHSVTLSFKEKNPETFDQLFEEYQLFHVRQGEVFMTTDTMLDGVMKVVEEDELCALHIDKIKTTIKSGAENMQLPKNSPQFREGAFTTLIHSDLWVNNIMVRSQKNKIVDVKLLDLQLYEYASVAQDLLFFLLTSLQEGVLKQHFEDLVRFYYDNLISNLNELNCETGSLLFGVFEAEMKKTFSQISYLRVIAATNVTHASSDHVQEVDEFDEEGMFALIHFSDLAKNRMWLITRKFIQKRWFK